MTIFTDLPVEVLELILLELPVPILLSLPPNRTLHGVQSRILQEYIARATNIPWRMYIEGKSFAPKLHFDPSSARLSFNIQPCLLHATAVQRYMSFPDPVDALHYSFDEVNIQDEHTQARMTMFLQSNRRILRSRHRMFDLVYVKRDMDWQDFWQRSSDQQFWILGEWMVWAAWWMGGRRVLCELETMVEIDPGETLEDMREDWLLMDSNRI
ncbi:unnamed protein product [Umbelopsis ramanniana]